MEHVSLTRNVRGFCWLKIVVFDKGSSGHGKKGRNVVEKTLQLSINIHYLSKENDVSLGFVCDKI